MKRDTKTDYSKATRKTMIEAFDLIIWLADREMETQHKVNAMQTIALEVKLFGERQHGQADNT